jgi:hypothetical protein
MESLLNRVRRCSQTALRQNLADHFPGHIRQPEIAALIAIGQTFLIHTQTMQDRRLNVVDMHGIFHHVVAVVVGLPTTMPAPPSIA